MGASVILNLPPSDVDGLMALLRRFDPFVVPPGDISDPYDLGAFLLSNANGGAAVRCLLDNNLVSTATKLSSGGAVSSRPSEEGPERCAAALMAFCIIADIQFEPNIALYEQAWRAPHSHALSQLELFRIADHVDPRQYVEIALGRANSIEQSSLDLARSQVAERARISRQTDFRTVLSNWKSTYLAFLKVIEIRRSRGLDSEKAVALIDWMETEHFFTMLPAVFALRHLAPCRPGGVLRKAYSTDPEKVSLGVQNAVWDCVYLKEWAAKAKGAPSNLIWIFGSLDSKSRELAELLLLSANSDPTSAMNRALGEFWPPTDLQLIVGRYLEAAIRIAADRDSRLSRVTERLADIDRLIRAQEQALSMPHARLAPQA